MTFAVLGFSQLFMNTITSTILLLVVCSLNLLAQSGVTEREYEFYKKFIEADYVLNRFIQKLDSTYMKSAKKKMWKAPKELFIDYELKNDKSYKIGGRLKEFRFTDQPKLNFDNGNQLVFIYERFAAVSRVGFTKNGKEALLYYQTNYDCCSGASAGIYWLKLKNTKWEIVDSYQPWIY